MERRRELESVDRIRGIANALEPLLPRYSRIGIIIITIIIVLVLHSPIVVVKVTCYTANGPWVVAVNVVGDGDERGSLELYLPRGRCSGEWYVAVRSRGKIKKITLTPIT